MWETDLLISRTQAIAHAKELRLIRETTQANYVGGVVRLMRLTRLARLVELAAVLMLFKLTRCP